MAKRIALFCDGTWNSAKQRFPTNVCLLAQSTACVQGVQHVHYFDGVGVKVDRLLGGLFGIGLDKILLEAYERLCADYEPGDALYLFGFSRGAYMARSLVGLMRVCGILKKQYVRKADEALQIYRQRQGGPDSRVAVAFRKHFSCASYRAPDFLGSPGALAVRYMGIWETIGALGIPQRMPFADLFNRHYQFHDCDLSSMVQRAQHALALDETRNALPHAPWSEESIRRINGDHHERRVEQVWFPGDHGSVGGGGIRAQLSAGALLWIADGAKRAGLTLSDERGHLRCARTVSDPVNGFLKNADGDPIGLRIQGYGPRLQAAPKDLHDVSESLRQRAEHRPSYLRERSLRGYWRRLMLEAVINRLESEPARAATASPASLVAPLSR